MILLPLVILDVVSGLVLLAKFGYLMFWLGLLSLLKGIWSLFASIKAGYFLDWMGAVDVFGGACMLLLSHGYYNDIFSMAGILLIAKGIYSFIATLHA